MTLKLRLEVVCERCGTDLDAYQHGHCIYVKPCDYCLYKEHENGYDLGLKDAKS